MDEQRRKTITNEIKYWKQNRMLPEHYCDYLLNLYTEGSSDSRSEPENSRGRTSRTGLISIILIGLLTLAAFLFYFTELSLFLQMALITFFGICSVVSGAYLIKNSFFELIPLLSSALIFLITSVQAAEIVFPDQPAMLYIVTAVNCLLWIAAGMKWTMVPFKISGVTGLIVLIITIFI